MERMLLDSQEAPGGVVVYYADGDEEIIHVNQYVVDLFDCDSADDFMAFTCGRFRNVIYDDDVHAAEDSIWGQVENQGGLDHIYYRIQTKTGRVKSVDDFGRLIRHDGERPVFIVFLVEVTQSGSIDWLTGLPTMARFYELARMGARAISSRGDCPVAVALDLMGMKTFNARYGRDAGDALLCAFATALRRSFGSEACSRFAEDHFYAFSSTNTVVERLHKLFDDFGSCGVEGVLPVRAGVYACDADDDIVLTGFDRAKIACDLDRTTWSSRIEWFTEEMRARARLRIYVLEHVDQAIAEGWIRPYYQAVVRAATGCICSEEALARWDDPRHGMLAPDQFIPVLEEAGLLQRVDMHMVDCVVTDMQTKREHGIPIVPVSINISVRDLALLNIAEEVSRRADAVALPHGLIRIEFTESAATSDSELFKSQVDALRDAGYEVWMDDFGSGYSSLNTLQEFDFDLIKLDMEFVRSERVEKSRVIVTGVVQAAGRLGVGTLAEGVETEEQATFLEGVGCDMLQGYFYAKPQPLEAILSQHGSKEDAPREPFDEGAYWSQISLVSLMELPASNDGQAVDMSPASEIPMGVVEWRNDAWCVVRANKPYADFLTKAGMLSPQYSSLRVNRVARQPDGEFGMAAERSRKTGLWERVMGRAEYGSGYQFYVRYLSSANDADAYMVAGAPTMLGSALGTFGDVPVAYAVFRVKLDEAASKAVDAEFVYASPMYREWGAFGTADLTGLSFFEVASDASEMWLPYCYRAVVNKERVHDIVYSPEVGHWLSFYIAPSPIEGCCVYAFALADDEHREREEMLIGLDTSDLIISIADALSGEASYDVAMNSLLETMSRIIHPDRLCIYERGEKTTSNTFEWCAEGVKPQIDTLQNVSNEEFEAWDKLMAEDSAVIVSDVTMLEQTDERMYRRLSSQGIARMLAVPFRNEGKLLGYLAADNYRLEEGLDTRRLLETVASFVSARIANRLLLEALDRAGKTDMLTGLLNRRGIDLRIGEHLGQHVDEPFAIALMDVDDFKRVNDRYGHGVGDEALREMARRIARTFPEDAIVGRNGGDEFLVMLPGRQAARVDELVERFLAQEFGFDFEGRHYSVSVSIGYVGYPEQAQSLAQAYSRADAALFSVKSAGKGGARRYAPDVDAAYRSALNTNSCTK